MEQDRVAYIERPCVINININVNIIFIATTWKKMASTIATNFVRTLRGNEECIHKVIDIEFDGDVHKLIDKYHDDIIKKLELSSVFHAISFRKWMEVLVATNNSDIKTMETLVSRYYGGSTNIHEFFNDYMHDIARYSEYSDVVIWAATSGYMSAQNWWDCIEGAASGGRVKLLCDILNCSEYNLQSQSFGFIVARAATKCTRINVLKWLDNVGEMTMETVSVILEIAVNDNNIEVLKFINEFMDNQSGVMFCRPGNIRYSRKTWKTVLDKGLYWMINALVVHSTHAEETNANERYGPDYKGSCAYVAKLAGLDADGDTDSADHFKCLRVLHAYGNLFEWNDDLEAKWMIATK